MPIEYDRLQTPPRLLMEAALTPLQGQRFQPTGFAHLGAARYTVPSADGNSSTEMLLVESAQSVANHLEAACWDEATDGLIEDLDGLPYVQVDCGSFGTTSSLKEFHRLNSPYIWSGEETESAKAFREAFVTALGLNLSVIKKKKKDDQGDGGAEVPGTLDLRKFYRAVFKWDPNSVIHGLFLEKVAGRLRMPRLLSGFIEGELYT